MDGNSRIAMIREGDDFGDTTPAVKYNLEDHLGSSTVLLETNGSLINKEEYYPYGETSFGSYAKKRYRFSGKEKDEESGLYYYGARYYMPWACKFISCDPMAPKLPQWSSYTGFNDNPIFFTDPTGMEGEGQDDWIKAPGSNQWVWSDTAKVQGVGNHEIRPDGTEVARAGHQYPSTEVMGTVTLGGSKGSWTVTPFVDGGDIGEVEITASRMTQAQIDAAFNPEREYVIGTIQEALAQQISDQTQAELDRLKFRMHLDKLFNGLDNLTLGMFAAGASPFVIGGAIIYTPTGIGALAKTGYGLYKGIKTGYQVYDKYVSPAVDESGIAYNYANQSYSSGNWGLGNKDLISLGLSGIELNALGKYKTPVQSALGTSGGFGQYTLNGGFSSPLVENSAIYSGGTMAIGAMQPLLGNSRFGNNLSSNFIFGTAQMGLNIYEKPGTWRK